MFAILSMVLILSLLGFGTAKEGAEVRVAALEAESMAQRVAGVYISASLFAETHVDDAVEYERLVVLPDYVQGRSYTVSVQDEQLILDIDALGIQVSTSLLSAGAPPDLVVCDQDDLAGGPLWVKAKPYDGETCTGRTTQNIILFLESA